MSTINVNSSYLKEAGSDIVRLTKEINELINNTFSLIENMPKSSGVWQGDAAMQFVSMAKLDKSNYFRFTNNMNKYGKYLIDYADSMESVIARVRL